MRWTRRIGSSLVFLGLAAWLPAAPLPLGVASAPPQPSLSAAGNSFAPQFSADGRFLLFLSQANNLVTNDDRGPALDLFVRDLQARRTVLASVCTNGGGGAHQDVSAAAISTNGSLVVFASAASNLAPGDTNQCSDIFLRDLTRQTTRLLSLAEDGAAPGNGDSVQPVLSADNRWVVFASRATNLVSAPFATNHWQIFAHDVQEQRTVLVSVAADGVSPAGGPCSEHRVSADGRWVVFVSPATNLAEGVAGQAREIYLRDVALQQTHWISSNAAPYFAEATNGYQCYHPVLSQNGAVVAFMAALGGTNQALLFCHDVAAEVTTLVSSNMPPEAWPELNEDGTQWFYEEYVVPPVQRKLKVWDRPIQSITEVPLPLGLPAEDCLQTRAPALALHGRQLAFLASWETPDAYNTTNHFALRIYHLLVHDLATGETRMLTRGPLPGRDVALDVDTLPVLSPEGRLVAFDSANEYLVPGDANRASDVFLCDTATGEMELVSVRHGDLPARTSSGACYVEPQGLSFDGRWVLFSSYANGLAAEHSHFTPGLYLMDLHTGQHHFIQPAIPAPYDDVLGLWRHDNHFPWHMPVLREDGLLVAMMGPYVKQSGDSEFAGGLLYDTATRSFQRWDIHPAGNVLSNCFKMHYNTVPRRNDWWRMAFSPDGRKLAYAASNLQLAGGTGTAYFNIYLFDLAARTNQLITRSRLGTEPGGGDNNSISPQFSSDGRWLVFSTHAKNLQMTDVISYTAGFHKIYAWDFHQEQYRIINTVGTNVFISPESRYLLYERSVSGVSTVMLHDLYENPVTNRAIFTNGWMPRASFDAEVIVFQARAANNITQIYATNRINSTMRLVTAALDGITPGNAPSGPPQITANGRYVLFESRASNLFLYDDNNSSDVFLRDLQLHVTYLLSANPRTGRSGNGSSTAPRLSGNDSTIVFASHASDLVPGDYNDKQDLFVVKLTAGDSDGDGLDDGWELAYFNSLRFNGQDDYDGDGLTNAQELRAGTDPTDRGSVLQALVMGAPGGGSTTLMWPAVEGRGYRVQYKTSLNDADWHDLDVPVEIHGPTARAVDPEAGLSAQRFYRIVIP